MEEAAADGIGRQGDWVELKNEMLGQMQDLVMGGSDNCPPQAALFWEDQGHAPSGDFET